MSLVLTTSARIAAQVAAAVAASTPQVAAAVKSDEDKLKDFVKNSDVGQAIVAGFDTARDPSLSGTQKMDALVTEVLPAAVSLFAKNGVLLTEAKQVEDLVRSAAQDLWNAAKSVTVGQLVTLAATLIKVL